MPELVIILIGISLLIWSVLLRVIRWRSIKKLSTEKEATQSPLSKTVQELVSTAEGVYYLALIMLIFFLRLDVIDKISLGGISCDPVAFFSLTLAVVQPFVLKIIHKE